MFYIKYNFSFMHVYAANFGSSAVCDMLS